ncbi:MAG TPA: hypothetical protein PKM78_08155 [Anaerolineae bacterium]|nr:hypothetical protein [Anaerolineae bacterium]HNU04285.1 hypothetical protein [Anaerolineae bacterium]
MEVLWQIFNFIADVVQTLIDVLAQLILGLSASMVDMTEAEAQMIATAVLGFVVFVWVARRTFWSKGFGVFKPMTITLQTTKTPWQVLMGDLRSCMITALAILVLVVFVMSVLVGG